MNKSHPFSNPYEIAYQEAIKELASRNLEEVAFASSARLEENSLLLNAFGTTFRIEDYGQKITSLSDKREVKIAEKIILLHYLITADGTPLSWKEVTFENIPGAGFYYPTYKARTIDRLLAVFQNDLSKFKNICEKLGAKVKLTQDIIRVKFLVLPNVPLDIIYWQGNEEIPPSCQIIYDANITHYLPLEDIVVITELLVQQIINLTKSNSSGASALYDYDYH